MENDETMIINSDNTIITTPIESPREYGSGLDVKNMYDTTNAKLESDTPTSETSTCSMIDSMLGEQKQKKHCRPKMKKETHAKYAKKIQLIINNLNWVLCLMFECLENNVSNLP